MIARANLADARRHLELQLYNGPALMDVGGCGSGSEICGLQLFVTCRPSRARTVPMDIYRLIPTFTRDLLSSGPELSHSWREPWQARCGK